MFRYGRFGTAQTSGHAMRILPARRGSRPRVYFAANDRACRRNPDRYRGSVIAHIYVEGAAEAITLHKTANPCNDVRIDTMRPSYIGH
jgi:hypothetical protein